MSSRSLIVMPDDTGKPILDAIDGARKSIRIKIFLFSEPSLIAAVIAAHQRGVKVRVMLNPARRSGEPENEVTRKTLEAAGIEVLGVTDHTIFKSIYFHDPSGHRLELACNTATPAMMKALDDVKWDMINEWDRTKKAPKHAAWMHDGTGFPTA